MQRVAGRAGRRGRGRDDKEGKGREEKPTQDMTCSRVTLRPPAPPPRPITVIVVSEQKKMWKERATRAAMEI